MTHTSLGIMLIDAPHSALNNAGNDTGQRTDNVISVKKIKKDWRHSYPYVSSQALRYWWRNALEQRYGWRVSPIDREKKTAFTKADPVAYPDDDLFGYMRAEKAGTLTRVSPFKCSPLISVTAQEPTTDFGVMSRHEGDPVPYEHEFYSVTLKGVFSLDLDAVGVFSGQKRSGYQNITEKRAVEAEEEEGLTVENGTIHLDDVERAKRASEWIAALPYLVGGAKQTGHLTEVSPVFIVLTGLSCGNHILMNVIGEAEDGDIALRLDSLEEALRDYREDLIAPVWIGRRSGFRDEWDKDIQAFIERVKEQFDIRYDTVKEVVTEHASWLQGFYAHD